MDASLGSTGTPGNLNLTSGGPDHSSQETGGADFWSTRQVYSWVLF